MGCTGASSIQVAPTFGKEQARHRPLVLRRTHHRRAALPARYGNDDRGRRRIRNKANERLPCPPGWVLNKDGLPSTDPLRRARRAGS